MADDRSHRLAVVAVPPQRGASYRRSGRHARTSKRTTPRRNPANSAKADDNWFNWKLALGAVIVPVALSMLVIYIISNQFTIEPVLAASRRGDFVFPTLIIWVDITRRWWQITKLRLVKKIAGQIASWISWSALAVFSTLAVLETARDSLELSGNAIGNFTIGGFVAAVILGTGGVVLSNKHIRGGHG